VKKIIFFVVLIIVFYTSADSLFVAYDNGPEPSEQGNVPPTQSDGERTAPAEKKDYIKEQIKAMTLDEKIGQMVMVGIDGYTLGDASRQMLEEYHAGGIILFKDNIRDAEQTLSLINALKSTNAINMIPLFLSVDEEGGRVSRMPDEMTNIPAAKKIGQVNNSDFSFKIGSLIGEELKAFGFNMDFAPVLDINSNPRNPVIGDRAFGSDPDIVSASGIQNMKGIQSQGIISVVKHFPGHGDTSTDSHIGLPSVDNDLQRLQSFELIPFDNAIRNSADTFMVAHILLPRIDPDYPASFSKKIITGILRENLKFDGVVFTDDMTMGAIINNYDIGNAAVLSVNAGSDIILICHDNDKQVTVINSLREAAESGSISMERIDASVYRILSLKRAYAITDETVKSIDIKAINNKISTTLNSYLKEK